MTSKKYEPFCDSQFRERYETKEQLMDKVEEEEYKELYCAIKRVDLGRRHEIVLLGPMNEEGVREVDPDSTESFFDEITEGREVYTTWNFMVGTYGDPLLRFKPSGKFTQRQMDMHSVPDECAIFKLKSPNPSQYICFARFGNRWFENAGERFAIRELINRVRLPNLKLNYFTQND